MQYQAMVLISVPFYVRDGNLSLTSQMCFSVLICNALFLMTAALKYR